jgi:hypothetical protein
MLRHVDMFGYGPYGLAMYKLMAGNPAGAQALLERSLAYFRSVKEHVAVADVFMWRGRSIAGDHPRA